MTMSLCDPDGAGFSRAYVFVAALPYSAKVYAEAARRMDERAWVEAHVRAFERFGGTTPIIAPDNLKTGIKRDTVEELVVNDRLHGEPSVGGPVPNRNTAGAERRYRAMGGAVPNRDIEGANVRDYSANQRAGVWAAPFIADSPNPPERPPGGIVAKQQSGWAFGLNLCLAFTRMTQHPVSRHWSSIWMTVRN